MATPDHVPTGRGFDTSFGYFHHANDFYSEIAGDCNETKIVDLWDTNKPAPGVNGTGPDKYEEGLFKERLSTIMIRQHHCSSIMLLTLCIHLFKFLIPMQTNLVSLMTKIVKSIMPWSTILRMLLVSWWVLSR